MPPTQEERAAALAADIAAATKAIAADAEAAMAPAMPFSAVENLRWANAERTVIECTVTFDGIGPAPFSVAAEDPYDHSQAIWKAATEGKYGAVAPYQPPAAPPADQVARRSIRDLEAAITPRRLREAILGAPGARDWLAAADAQIAALRDQGDKQGT